MTTDDTYFERGINLRHGFLTEYVVDEPEYIVRVPENLKDVGVLMEPMSVAQKPSSRPIASSNAYAYGSRSALVFWEQAP